MLHPRVQQVGPEHFGIVSIDCAKARSKWMLTDFYGRLLVQTPYVLLLAIPGIHVASAGELAGEMGPITHYAHARAITGRAGLFPSRYQSDQVDLANGALVRCGNCRLRAALLGIANNLLKCNHYFRGLADRWKAEGKDPRDARVKVSARFSRLAYLMVAGPQVVPHRYLQPRGYILDKLIAFHQEHDIPPPQMLANLHAAVAQLPAEDHALEAIPLVKRLRETHAARGRGPQPIGNILPILLARLGVGKVQSTTAGGSEPQLVPPGQEATTPSFLVGQTLREDRRSVGPLCA